MVSSEGENGGDVGAELGAEAAGDPAMDDGRAEILLGGVVGGRDVRAVEKDEQAGAVLLIASLQTAGVGRVGLLGEEGAEHQSVDGVLDAASAAGELGRRERRPDLVQVDGPAEQVAQLDGPDAPGVAVGLDGVGQVPDPMDLMPTSA